MPYKYLHSNSLFLGVLKTTSAKISNIINVETLDTIISFVSTVYHALKN